MTQRSVWRPENALILAVILIGGAVFVAGILMIAGVLGGGSPEGLVPYGIALVVVASVAAFLILGYSRKLRRQQRPEWLETQAWRKGLIDKLHESDTARKPPENPKTP